MGRKKENGVNGGVNGFEEKVSRIVEQLRELDINDYFLLPENPEGYEIAVGVWAVGSKGSYAIKLRRENSHPASYIVKIRSKMEFEALKTLVDYLEQNKHILEAIDRLNGNTTKKVKTPKGKILQF